MQRGGAPPTGETTGSSRRNRSGVARGVRVAHVALVLAGAGLVIVVGHDGTPLWRAAHVLVVAVLLVVAWHAIGSRRSSTAAQSSWRSHSWPFRSGPGSVSPISPKRGSRSSASPGSAALVGGVVLFVGALAMLLHSARPLIAVPASAVLVVLLLVLIWSLGQAVAATNPPRPQLGSRTPADLGLAFTTSSSEPSTACDSRVGTSRRVAAPQWSCSTARIDPVQRPRPRRRPGTPWLRRPALRRPGTRPQ